jgi:putative ABC transport system permease protein
MTLLLHYVRLALKSMRRNPILSSLIVAAIALGIAVSTSFLAMYHVLAADPLPGRSQRLHWVRMDSWDPARPYPGDQDKPIPPQITFPDMRNIMKSDIPVRQTGSYKANLYVYPDPDRGRPFRARVRLAFSDFFPMFELPFQYGGPWDKAADAGPEPVAVIDHATNDKLFGGGDSVGKTFRMQEREFKVVGVLAPWKPTYKYYDLTQNQMQDPEDVYIPLNHAEPMLILTGGNSDGWKGSTDSSPGGLFRSEICFVQMWVELADDKARQAYLDYLEAYVLEQKRLGRFGRPIDNRVTSLTDLMVEFNVIPSEVKSLASISVLFLTVCSLNLMGLLLGKFLARAPEVGVRRALGASRTAIFLQHIVECELIGILGGVIGIALSVAVLVLFNRILPFGDPFGLDTFMLAAATLLSLGAGLVAGLYPAWRICSIPPASYLRVG